MDILDKKSKKRSKSTNNSPIEEMEKRDPSPKIKIIGSSPSSSPTPRIVCPRCKTSTDVVRLGLSRDNDTGVYFCGLQYSSERACRNVWMPECSYIQIDEVVMRYMPGPDGDYVVTFK
jgi:hypothetical protein